MSDIRPICYIRMICVKKTNIRPMLYTHDMCEED